MKVRKFIFGFKTYCDMNKRYKTILVCCELKYFLSQICVRN